MSSLYDHPPPADPIQVHVFFMDQHTVVASYGGTGDLTSVPLLVPQMGRTVYLGRDGQRKRKVADIEWILEPRVITIRVWLERV